MNVDGTYFFGLLTVNGKFLFTGENKLRIKICNNESHFQTEIILNNLRLDLTAQRDRSSNIGEPEIMSSPNLR